MTTTTVRPADHQRRGEWGDADTYDRRVNDGAVHYGERLLSVYAVADGTRTTFPSPAEY